MRRIQWTESSRKKVRREAEEGGGRRRKAAEGGGGVRLKRVEGAREEADDGVV